MSEKFVLNMDGAKLRNFAGRTVGKCRRAVLDVSERNSAPDGLTERRWDFEELHRSVSTPVKMSPGALRRQVPGASPEAQDSGATLGNGADLTRRKVAEQARLRLDHRLLHAQKLESMGVLAGCIAHDFNNILMVIVGNADLALLRIDKDSPAVENLHRIEQAAARAAELTSQMLAYSGKGKFIVESLDLNLLLKAMLPLLEVSISKKTVIRLNLPQQLPAVEGDAAQLHQIIMNLVINASEAIEGDSSVIDIVTGCQQCDRSYLKEVWQDDKLSEGPYVYLQIADTGCGMDQETMAQIFDPFFTTKSTGRGLGMAAVLGIVKGHRGSIKVYSEPGRGTTFKLLLPASGFSDAIKRASEDG